MAKAKLRHRIEHGFEQYGRVIFANRLKTLGLMLLLIASLLSQLPKITSDTSNESYFHQEDPTIQNYTMFKNQFGREELVVIAVGPANVFEKSFLEKLGLLHEKLEEEVPYLDKVTSLINVRQTRGEGDELIVEDLLKDIPDSPEAMALLKQRVLGSTLYPNYLISEDGDFTILLVKTLAFSPGAQQESSLESLSDSAFDSIKGDEGAEEASAARIPLTPEENAEVVAAVRTIVASMEGPDFRIHPAGQPIMSDYFSKTMEKDMSTFLGAAFLAISVFLLLLFRKVAGVVLPMLVDILSLASTVSLMAMAGVPFTIPTTILPSFLLAVGVGACVHLLTVFFRNYAGSGDKKAALSYALGHSGLPIFMTGLTTSAGLFSFSTAEMAPVAHLGIFAGSGVLISLVYTLVLIPALLALWPLRKPPAISPNTRPGFFDRLLEGIARLAVGRPWSIVLIATGLILAAGIGMTQLTFTQDFIKWFPEDEPLRMDMVLIDRELKGSMSLEVVVDTKKENGLYEPALLQGMEKLIRYSEAYTLDGTNPIVAKTGSLISVVKETNQALNENRSEFYNLPPNRALIAQELFLFENSGSDDLQTLVDTQFSKARVSLTVPTGDGAIYVDFVEAIKNKAELWLGAQAEVTVTGSMNLFTQMMYTMLRSMTKSYLLAGVVITVLMMILIGSLRIGLLSMLVNFTPIFVTMGLMMGFWFVDLDVMTLVTGSIALGLAVDDTIHFFHNFRRYYGQSGDVYFAVRETLLTSGRAMLFTTLVLVTGFWLFMLATLNSVFNFGFVTGAALIVALLSDFLLAPALLTLIIRTPYGRRTAARWVIFAPAAGD